MKADPSSALVPCPASPDAMTTFGVAGEHRAALESALDGFPDRIHPHSSRTVTPSRFRSPSKVLAKFWQISGRRYDVANQALLRVRSVSAGLREARPGARRHPGSPGPQGCGSAAGAGPERRTPGGQRRPDEAGLARRLCRGRKPQQEHLRVAESLGRVGRRAGIHRDCAQTRLPVRSSGQRGDSRRGLPLSRKPQPAQTCLARRFRTTACWRSWAEAAWGWSTRPRT